MDTGTEAIAFLRNETPSINKIIIQKRDPISFGISAGKEFELIVLNSFLGNQESAQKLVEKLKLVASNIPVIGKSSFECLTSVCGSKVATDIQNKFIAAGAFDFIEVPTFSEIVENRIGIVIEHNYLKKSLVDARKEVTEVRHKNVLSSSDQLNATNLVHRSI